MSRLVSLIDEYKDTHGQPSDASIARAVGIEPQTVSAWRNRGVRELPRPDTLMRLAAFLGYDYDTVVLDAVLRDTGWRKDDEPAPSKPSSGGEVREA